MQEKKQPEELILQEGLESEEESRSRFQSPAHKEKPLDPTRYGDWEKKGRCIDF